MEVGRSAFSEMNNNLCSFAMRWELDGDYMRCRKCNRPQITDYANVDFVHKADCKAAGNVEARPWETFLLLLAPLIHANSVTAPPRQRREQWVTTRRSRWSSASTRFRTPFLPAE